MSAPTRTARCCRAAAVGLAAGVALLVPARAPAQDLPVTPDSESEQEGTDDPDARGPDPDSPDLEPGANDPDVPIPEDNIPDDEPEVDPFDLGLTPSQTDSAPAGPAAPSTDDSTPVAPAPPATSAPAAAPPALQDPAQLSPSTARKPRRPADHRRSPRAKRHRPRPVKPPARQVTHPPIAGHTEPSQRSAGSLGAPPSASHRPVASAGAARYTVRAGDTLWDIAQRRLGNSASAAAVAREVNRLWSLNASRVRSHDPDVLAIGEQLRLS